MYNFLPRNVRIRTISEYMRCYSSAKKSHYEVLKLKKNCTDKQIKDAFIKLSKEYHPDKNKDSDAQTHFVRIVEAYNILGKPSSRARYDSMIDVNPSTHHFYTRAYNTSYNTANNRSYKDTYHTTRPPQDPPNYYHTSYGPRPRAKQSSTKESETYYGGLGVKRIPNYVLILICISIAFVGTVIQVYVIRIWFIWRFINSSTDATFDSINPQHRPFYYGTYIYLLCGEALFKKRELYVVQKKQAMERTKFLADELDKVRAAAQGNTNEMQTRILLEKIVGSSNPTIATASLGQSLASEKK